MLKIETGKPSLMRDLNTHIVLNIIRTKNITSKIEISRISKLKPPTVSNIINKLESENLVLHVGKGETNTKGGPRPDLYKINPQGKFFIGIDIGAKGIVGVVLDLEGKIVQKIYNRDSYENQESLTNMLKTVIKSLFKKSGLDKNCIESISVSVAAMVDAEKGVTTVSNISALNIYRIRDILVEEFSVRVYVDTDVNFLAIGSDWSEYSNDRNKNTLCIVIRTGIGLGIVINGELYRGSNGLSGNIGHCHIDGDEKCDCGISGCLETVAGENAILTRVKEYARKNNEIIRELNLESVDDIDIFTIYAALRQSNTKILDMVKDSLHYLGVLIGELIQLFNPHNVIISGEIFNHNESLFDYLICTSKKYSWRIAYENVQFKKMLIDDTTIAYGAAIQALKRFYNTSELVSRH